MAKQKAHILSENVFDRLWNIDMFLGVLLCVCALFQFFSCFFFFGFCSCLSSSSNLFAFVQNISVVAYVTFYFLPACLICMWMCAMLFRFCFVFFFFLFLKIPLLWPKHTGTSYSSQKITPKGSLNGCENRVVLV